MVIRLIGVLYEVGEGDEKDRESFMRVAQVMEGVG